MRYPRLNNLALNLLNVLVSNVKIKRIFSKCVLAFNNKRLSITPKTFKKFIFFRLWRRWEERGEQIDINASSLLYVLLIFIKIFGGDYIDEKKDRKGKELFVIKNTGIRC